MIFLSVVLIFSTQLDSCRSFHLQNVNISENDGILGAVFVDIVKNIPVKDLTILFDDFVGEDEIKDIVNKFHTNLIALTLINVTDEKNIQKFYTWMQNRLEMFEEATILFFTSRKVLDSIFSKVEVLGFQHRHYRYIIYWNFDKVRLDRIYKDQFKLIVVTNDKNTTFRLFTRKHISHYYLSLINWWSINEGLYKYPTLPAPKSVYSDFKNVLLRIPVLHSPPWFFVKYTNYSLHVLGGRDRKLLDLVSEKMNFRYKFIDPRNGTNRSDFNALASAFKLLKEKKADLFLGDVKLTFERSKTVEFSFITLADSSAFVTHSPRRLNEALALVQPFKFEVWPAIIGLIVLSGPFLYFLITFDYKSRKIQKNLFRECIWFCIALFLKQPRRCLTQKTRPKIFTIILSIIATYVIADIYSANLTSLLAKPYKEKPVHSIEDLHDALESKNYKLYVINNSSPYFILQNGTGLYGKLWKLMRKQKSFLVKSIEDGVKKVKYSRNTAVIAGKETLFFDIQRFGPSFFHLSEKLNTEYSAIAFPIGCPYIETFNKILITTFEAGIMTKMTDDEYQKLDKQHFSKLNDLNDEIHDEGPNSDENKNLEPLNVKMLQGAFYVILMGYLLASLAFLAEWYIFKNEEAKKMKKWLQIRLVRDLRTKLVSFRKTEEVYDFVN